MSYLLEFPPRANPCNERKPPFVWFGIRDQDITAQLPERIPLAMALSFIPKLEKWIMTKPDPAKFDKKFNAKLLCEPHVGIMIDAPVDADAFSWIIKAMLQAAGVAQPSEKIMVIPTFKQLITIHSSWLVLGLPEAGIYNLDLNMYMRLNEDRVFLQRQEMKAVWENYPHSGKVVSAMAHSFFRGVINLMYEHKQVSAIVYFWLDSNESFRYYRKLKEQYGQAYEDASSTISRARNKKTVQGSTSNEAAAVYCARIAAAGSSTLEPDTSGSPSSPEKKKLVVTNKLGSPQPALRKVESDDSIDSIETAIWSPKGSIGYYDLPEDRIEARRRRRPSYDVGAEIDRAMDKIRRRHEADVKKSRIRKLEAEKKNAAAASSMANATAGSSKE